MRHLLMLQIISCQESIHAEKTSCLIGDDIKTIERNADVLLNACKDIDLTVNTGKTKYIEVRHHQEMMANGYIKR